MYTGVVLLVRARENVNLTIKKILLTVLMGLGLFVTVVGANGWWALSRANEALQTVYVDRLVPMQNLKDISDAYAVFIVDASHKVRNGNTDRAQGLASIERAKSEISKSWRAYLATSLNAEETRLVDEARKLMVTADVAVAELEALLHGQDTAGLNRFIRERLYQDIDPLTEKIGELTALQVRVGAEEYARSQANHEMANLVAVGLILMASLMVAGGVAVVIFRVIRPIDGLTAVMGALARGDHSVEVPGVAAHTEIGAMGRAVEVFKHNGLEMRRLQAEQEQVKARAETERKTAMIKLADEFESTVMGVVQTVSSSANEMQSSATVLSANADQAFRQAMAAAVAADQASSSVGTVASATEELSASIGEIGRQVENSTRIAAQAVEDANRTNASMRCLEQIARKLGRLSPCLSPYSWAEV
jgi:methyl-accepting chemotaxis protein